MTKKILILILILLIIASFAAFYSVHTGQIIHHPQDVIYRSNTVQISVPSCPLLEDSLSVESIFAEKSLAQWHRRQHAESYNLLENVASLWREQEFIDDFMVIGMIPSRMHADRFFWEIIPFPKTGLNFMDQFWVIWGLIFNSSCLSKNERQSIKDKYDVYVPFFSHAYQFIPEQTNCPSNDVFCDPKVIAKQLLYEGQSMRVLYNYAPIGSGSEKLHFLIIPKEHRTGFPELSLDEYLEAQEMASKLITYFANKGFPVVYLFHKTGKFAGQTIPHWHEHVIFAPDENHEFVGKLMILYKMLFRSQPLPDDQLEELVNKYKLQVQEALTEETKKVLP